MPIASRDALSKDTKKRLAIVEFIQKYGIRIILLVILLFFSFLTNGITLAPRNIFNILVNMTPVTLIALGVTIIIITNGIDLSSGSILACSAVVAASFAQVSNKVSNIIFPNMPNLPFIIPILVGLLVGALVGFINGWLVSKTGIPPFIATLGMMTSVSGITLIWAKGNSISGLNLMFKVLEQGTFLGVPIPIYILVIMVVFTHILLSSTRFGRYAYAIGGNIKAAEVSGIDTSKYLIRFYTYAGFLAGLAGVMITGILDSAQPILGLLYELDAIASSVIGGTSLLGGVGSIPGTVVGVLIIGVLKNSLDLLFVNAYWQQVIRGVIIILAVILDVLKQRLRSQ